MTNEADSFLRDIVARIDLQLDKIGISRREASIRAGLGPDFVREISRGRQPSILKMIQFAKSIGAELPWLIGTDSDPPPRSGQNHRSPREIEAYLAALDIDSIQPIRKYVLTQDNAALQDLARIEEAARGARAERKA